MHSQASTSEKLLGQLVAKCLDGPRDARVLYQTTKVNFPWNTANK